MKKNNTSALSKSAFTLMELLVVVAIIILITTMLMISFTDARAKARDVKRKQDIAVIEKALTLYWEKNSQFPSETGCDSSLGSCAGQCTTCGQNNWSQSGAIWQGLVGGGFLAALPKDPFNNSTYYYYYEPCCNEDCGNGADCIDRGCCEYTIAANKLEMSTSSYIVWKRWLQ